MGQAMVDQARRGVTASGRQRALEKEQGRAEMGQVLGLPSRFKSRTNNPMKRA